MVIRLILLVLFFSMTFHYAYVTFISPIYAYAYYIYNNPSILSILITYLFLIYPLIFYKNRPTASYYGVIFIYILCYLPGQLMLVFMWKYSFYELFLIQIIFMISMSMLFFISTKVIKNISINSNKILPSKKIHLIISILTIISIFLIIITYYKYMRIVSFSDVYELRFETNSIETSFVIDYMLLWLTFVLIPYFFAIGIINKNKRYILIGLFSSLVIYASTGAKIALMMGALIFTVNFIFKRKGDFLANILLYSAVFMLFIIIFVPDDMPWIYLKAMTFIRIFGTPGWMLVTYYEFFSEHGYTFYNHINIIKFLFENYPYGDYSLGQMIGIEYSGSSDANFNANFWASDGIAALGIWGILIATFFLSLFLFLLNNVSRHYNSHFLCLFLVGYWQVLLNVPFMTSLLSGGGLLILILLYLRRMPQRKLLIKKENKDGIEIQTVTKKANMVSENK